MPSDPSYLEQLKGYSLSELLDIQDHIDKQTFPDRYSLVVAEIKERRSALSPEDSASLADRESFPDGKATSDEQVEPGAAEMAAKAREQTGAIYVSIAFVSGFLFLLATIAVHLLSMQYGSRIPSPSHPVRVQQHATVRYVASWVYTLRLLLVLATLGGMVSFFILNWRPRDLERRGRGDVNLAQMPTWAKVVVCLLVAGVIGVLAVMAVFLSSAPND